MLKKLITLNAILSTLVVVSVPASAQSNASSMGLANKYSCTSCHNADVKLIGPAFKSVAEKYKDQPDALKTLATKVRNGGAGNWGRIPMPAHPDVPEADLNQLVSWVLKGAPSQ